MGKNDNYYIEKSFELTKLAIEHNYISKTDFPEQTANDTYMFYKTLLDNFTKEDS